MYIHYTHTQQKPNILVYCLLNVIPLAVDYTLIPKSNSCTHAKTHTMGGQTKNALKVLSKPDRKLYLIPTKGHIIYFTMYTTVILLQLDCG